METRRGGSDVGAMGILLRLVSVDTYLRFGRMRPSLKLDGAVCVSGCCLGVSRRHPGLTRQGGRDVGAVGRLAESAPAPLKIVELKKINDIWRSFNNHKQ